MTLPRIQDDLYLAVNGEWQAKTPIPPDKSVVSADSNLCRSSMQRGCLPKPMTKPAVSS